MEKKVTFKTKPILFRDLDKLEKGLEKEIKKNDKTKIVSSSL